MASSKKRRFLLLKKKGWHAARFEVISDCFTKDRADGTSSCGLYHKVLRSSRGLFTIDHTYRDDNEKNFS